MCLLFLLPSASLFSSFLANRSRFPNLYLDSWTAPSVSLRPRMAPKKPSSTAEVALVPLKNCLVNLPPSLVALLVNANTVSSSSNFYFKIGFLFPLSALTRESDCAECHCRAAVPTDGREAQREPRAAVLLPGMDRHAEQAQTCAGGRARWNQQFLFHQRAGRLDGRARYNVRAGSRTFRGTTGKMSPQVSASAHRDYSVVGRDFHPPRPPRGSHYKHRASDSGGLGKYGL